MDDPVTSLLYNIQIYAQKKWNKMRIFDSNPKYDDPAKKVFVTSPMPYADTYISLDRAQALITADVIANYQALQGKNVLYALNFQFSGTRIKVL